MTKSNLARTGLMFIACLFAVSAAASMSGCATTPEPAAPPGVNIQWEEISTEQAETMVRGFMGGGVTLANGQFGGAAKAFMGTAACTTAAIPLVIPYDKTQPGAPSEIFIHNYTADIAYIFPAGQVASKANGIPLCNVSSTCMSWFKIPSGNTVYDCAGATGTVTIKLLGIAQ